MVLTSTETVRLTRDGEKEVVERYGGGGEVDYIPLAKVSPPE